MSRRKIIVESEKGFSLVELMVAMAILLIAILPIFGSLYGVLYKHRNILDNEIAIGLAQSVENILESQEKFYTYEIDDGDYKVVALQEVDDKTKDYPIILHKDNAGASENDYVLSITTNNKTFTARAYGRPDLSVCQDITKDSCSYTGNKYLYAVRIVVKWTELGVQKEFVIARHFYKPH